MRKIGKVHSESSLGRMGRDRIASLREEDYENVTLMHSKLEKIPLKDFGSEVRALMDVDSLLHRTAVILGVQETNIEDICHRIIQGMTRQENADFKVDEVKSALFIRDEEHHFDFLSTSMQSISATATESGHIFDFDQTWLCALCCLPTVQQRYLGIARLAHPTNLGRTMQDVRYVAIIVAPAREKGTKTAVETGRTFATLFADIDTRHALYAATSVDSFRLALLQAAKSLAADQRQWRDRKLSRISMKENGVHMPSPTPTEKSCWYPGRGLKNDLVRRLSFYVSDYTDGFRDRKSIQKMLSTTVFLFFACVLPCLALGVQNDDSTHGVIDVKKALFGQAIGGIFFALFGGQPVMILLTTAPIALFIKVIHEISETFNLDFLTLYALIGIWCQIFLMLYSVLEASKMMMRYATRSTEDLFALFIAVAFAVQAFKSTHHNFAEHYHSSACEGNGTLISDTIATVDTTCQRDASVLYLLLMFGTLWLGLFLFHFTKTPYLTVGKRELLADFALPVAVIVMTFTGAYCFRNVLTDRFPVDSAKAVFSGWPNFSSAEVTTIFASMGLGFCLSLLFFIDQNMSSAILNNPQNKLRKGSGTHLDLFVVALLNVFLSLAGMPWMHAALPHSPLHLRALADVEERVSQGHVHEVITLVREVRVTGLLSHILLGASALWLLFDQMSCPLVYIPRAVLAGLFLYMAITSLNGNEMFDRIMLLFTEQAAYPPTHYIRRVPQRSIHLFTLAQLVQLAVLCVVGFVPNPFVEMLFPVVVCLFLPLRHLLIPKFIPIKFLDALDVPTARI